MILSATEMILGFFYIWDKRGKTGALGTVLVMCSGYAFPKIELAGIFLLLFGIGFYGSSEKSDF